MSTDYTACSGEGCPIKDSCKRFTGAKSNHQSYFMEVPMTITDDWFYCDEFWDNKEDKHLTELNNIISQDFDKYEKVFKRLA